MRPCSLFQASVHALFHMREITVLRLRNALGVSSVRFPNLPYSRSPESAGREAALEVGLETCAASGQAVRSYSQL